MKKVTTVSIAAEQKKSYPIFVGAAAPCIFRFLHTQGSSFGSVVIITDSTVRRLHAVSLQQTLMRLGNRAHLFSFPAGEKSKTAKTKNMLDSKLLGNKCGRDTLIIALGGGVVGDMAGFVASTYLRGVPYIQIPTTLLAMVDSSIGGKTGIDTPYGKNMIGSFWQPSAVIIDPSFLATLPQKHIQNGLLEIIKIHFVRRKEMGSSIRAFLHGKDTAIPLIEDALIQKARVVQRDEKESGERMILNFGHTIGHAIENVSGYTVLHGIAIGYGMLAEAHISHELGILPSSALASIIGLLGNAGIHQRALRKWDIRAIMAATKHDKKRRGGDPLYVLLRNIGVVYRNGNSWAHPVPDSIVKKVFVSLTR